MKHLLIQLSLCIIFTTTASAQLTQAQIQAIFSRPANITNVNCTPLTSTGICNYFSNNNFTPTSEYDPTPSDANPSFHYPFSMDLVPGWKAAQGSAQIADQFDLNIISAPPPAIGYAFLGIYSPLNLTEGIAQTIPAVISSQKYCLSFFIKQSFSSQQPIPALRFKIVLMRCSDYGLVNNTTGVTPAIPAFSQTVYCNTSFNNTIGWEQKMVTFTANDNYDLVWIFPDMQPPVNFINGIDFAFPELINTQNFTAGPAPTPYSPLCIVTIGPTVPNCSVANAEFKWTGPAGQIIIPSATQQISVDASIVANRGIWTLSMTPPTTINNTGNTCSQLLTVSSSSVVVPSCQTPCIVLPLIQ